MISDEAIHEVAAAVVAEQEQRTEMPQRDRRPYWVMYAWLTAATIYDVEATFYRLNHCVECREGNPILRPLVESGRLATYAYSAVLNAAVMYIARRLFDARDPWWRVTPMTFAVVHAIAGTRNLYLGAQGKS